jgi:hypothetical protein
MDEGIKKMWYIYTMHNRILSFAGKWMELENIMVSETS